MGQPPPDRIGNAPDIEPSYILWWTAWQDLSTERSSGGLVPIPFLAMASYANIKNLDLGLLKSIIYGLDHHYLEHERKRIKARKETQSNG